MIKHERSIEFESAEELQDTLQSIEQLDPMTESWLDSELHRIYFTYAYADITMVN